MFKCLRCLLFSILVVVLVVSCSENDEKTGKSSLIEFFEEPSGENCLHGGTGVNTGIDLNGNDSLDKDEINDTVYICDSKDGADGADGADGTDGADSNDGTDGTDGVDGADGTDGADGNNGSDGKDGICADNTVPVIKQITVSPEVIRAGDSFSVIVSAEDSDGTQALSWTVVSNGAKLISSSDGTFDFTAETPGTWSWKAVVSDGCEISVKTFAVTILNRTYSGFHSPFESQVSIKNKSGENHEYVLYFRDYNDDIASVAWKVFKLNDNSDMKFDLENEFEVAVIKEDEGSETTWYIPGKTGNSSKLYTFSQLSPEGLPEWSISEDGLGDGSFLVKNSSSSYKPFSFFLMNNENTILARENVLLDETVRFEPVPKLYLHIVTEGETFKMGQLLPASVVPSSDIEIDLLDSFASQITVECGNGDLCALHYGDLEPDVYPGINIDVKNDASVSLKTLISANQVDVNSSFETIMSRLWKIFNINPEGVAKTTYSDETELAVYENDFPQTGDLRRTFLSDRTVETGDRWTFGLSSADSFCEWSKSVSAPDSFQVDNSASSYKPIYFAYLKSGSPLIMYRLFPSTGLVLKLNSKLYFAAIDSSSIVDNSGFSLFSITSSQTEVNFIGHSDMFITIGEDPSTGAIIFDPSAKKSVLAVPASIPEPLKMVKSPVSKNVIIKNNTDEQQKAIIFGGTPSGLFKPVIWKLIELEPAQTYILPVSENWQFKAVRTDPVTSEKTEVFSPGIVKGDVYQLVNSSETVEWSKNILNSTDGGRIAINKTSEPYQIDIYLDGNMFVQSYFKTISSNQMNFHEKSSFNFSVIDKTLTLTEENIVPDSISSSAVKFSTSVSSTIQITLEKNTSGTLNTDVKYGE